MSTNRKLVSVGLGAVIFLQAVGASAALNAYLTLKGQKQGTLKGASTREKDATPVVAFAHQLVSPRDAASGLATGKRMHKPLTVTVEVGPGVGAEWKAAAATGEVFSEATLTLLTTPPPGKTATVFETVKLKNAVVTKIAEGLTDNAASSAEKERYLRLTIDYQELHTTVVKPDGTTAADEWAPNDQI
ncbi:MAG: type VI secretion system tube protein Hcp [Polyangiaceae bacterium]